jgi:hydroxymethylglutaryl-CoA reductase (NADPH)
MQKEQQQQQVHNATAHSHQPKLQQQQNSTSTQKHNLANKTREELLDMIDANQMKFFNLENELRDNVAGVELRRDYVQQKTGNAIEQLPYLNYNYEQIKGQCCENVIGIVPIPVGVAGPITVDGAEYYAPMATTEGALIASTTRGCKALSLGGGTRTEVLQDGMTRAPVLAVPNVRVGNQVVQFLETNFDAIAASFNSTSRFARLTAIKCTLAGRKLFVRFRCTTGDAMGMNMTGKAVEHCLRIITDEFPDSGVEVLSLSGNLCTDKKPSAVNWIEGRGKSVVADCVVPGHVVKSVLKTTVQRLCEVNYAKNFVGSALAGSVGGNNAHAANVVTAMFLATGQDPAQNVESSNCMTLIEPHGPTGEDLYIRVTMPSLEVATVGGGTSLPGLGAMLDLLGVRGAHATTPGANAQRLARVVASTVMAGELSLMSALSSGHLISSHMALNRKPETSK